MQGGQSMRKVKILTIDDSPDMLVLEKILLEREGFEVFTANNALSALEMIPNIHDLGLILVDVQMDNMDGLEFVKHLEADHQRVFRDTPVVLVTALDKAPEAKVAGCIRKISNLDEFVSKVRNFIFSAQPRPA